MNKKSDEKTQSINIAGPVFDGQHRDISIKRDPIQVYIDVTPKIAEEYLAKNGRNRKPVEASIEQWAKKMRSGEWTVSESDICVGEDGDLYNGQHRLMAVIRTGLTVRMSFKLGMPPESRRHMDTNKVRTAGDICYIETGERHGRTASAVYLALHFLKARGNIASNSKASWEMLDTQHKEHGDDLAAVVGAMKDNDRQFMSAPIISALVIAYRLHPNKVLEFARKLVTGADLPAGSPVLALRKEVFAGNNVSIERKRSKARDPVNRDAINSKTFVAIHNYVHGNARLFVREGESLRAKYLAPWRKEDAEK